MLLGSDLLAAASHCTAFCVSRTTSPGAEERRAGWGQPWAKIPQTSNNLTEVQYFISNKFFSTCYMTLDNLQSTEIIIFDSFVQLYHWLLEKGSTVLLPIILAFPPLPPPFTLMLPPVSIGIKYTSLTFHSLVNIISTS